MHHVLPSRAADASYGLFTVRLPPPTHDNLDMSCWARLGNPQCFLSSSSDFFRLLSDVFTEPQRSTHNLTLPHVHPSHPRALQGTHGLMATGGSGVANHGVSPLGFAPHTVRYFPSTPFLPHPVRFLCGWVFKRSCTRARNHVRPPEGRLLTYTYVPPHLVATHRSLQNNSFSGPTTADP